MAHLGTVGTAVQSTTASSVALTLTAAVPVGATVLLGIAWDAPSPGGTPTISSVVDSRGNTWTTTPDMSVAAGTTVAVGGLRARVTTALQIGDTITVTISSAARGRWAMQADAFDDLDASPLDKTATNAPGSSTALSSGVTAATAQATELVYCVFGFGGGRTVTVPGGWTGGAKVETSAGSGDRALQVIHKYVAATGTQEGTLTLSSSSTYAGAIATYTYPPPDPGDPVAQVSQVAMEAPNPGNAAVAKVAQVALETPQAGTGEIRVSQVRLTAPAGEGQPYTGLRIARDGGWWNAGVHVLG